MKILVAVALILFTSSVWATVVDSFSCELTLKDLVTRQKVQQKAQFDVARRPLSQSPYPGLYVTTGQASIRAEINNANSTHTMTVDIDIDYNHAIKEGSDLSEARQSFCLAPSTFYCPKTQKPEQCVGLGQVCGNWLVDPFDPQYGWTPVTIVDGVPIFDQRLLTVAEGSIFDNYNIPPPSGDFVPPSGEVVG